MGRRKDAYGQGRMSRTLLVTGIHREELRFGDRVAALVDPDQVEVLRIARALADKRRHIYVGLEVYLAQPGAGGPDDWRFARELIGHICDCGAMH